ncbi:hypothetical protein XELAEV_18008399mg [Xenopus laevis]|uniref:Uncharacterized protein n=1 Tax=Xenopus laevis TaxID=8355 RepID=A0A974I5K5_XENLA|nr:hypothetical protein XELAEV_18008399mg [Xenopus laevis]
MVVCNESMNVCQHRNSPSTSGRLMSSRLLNIASSRTQQCNVFAQLLLLHVLVFSVCTLPALSYFHPKPIYFSIPVKNTKSTFC